MTSISESMSVSENPTMDLQLACGQEYETQFFGFTPKSFSDGMYNAISDYTGDCLHAAEEIMKAEFKHSMTEDQFKAASQSIFPVLSKTMNKAFDKFETYLFTNIFLIPGGVALPEDKVHEKYQYTEEQEAELDQKIHDLKDKVKNSKYVSACLRQQLQDLGVVEEQYQVMLKQQQTLDRLCKDSGVSGLKESLEFTQDKVKKLRSIVEHIKPLTPQRKPLDRQDIQMQEDGSESSESLPSSQMTGSGEPEPMIS